MVNKIIATPVARLAHDHYYLKLNVKKLAKVSQFYEKQRTVNNTRVQQIVEFQNEHIRKHGIPLNMGTIILSKLNNNLISINGGEEKRPNKYYILDGQHRFEALKRLIKDNIIQDVEIVVEILEVPSYERMFELFQIINRAVPVAQHYLTPNEIINDVVAVITTEFPKALTENERPIRPSINIDKFKDTLLRILEEKIYIKTREELVKFIKDINQICYSNGVEEMCDMVARKNQQQRQIVENIFKKCIKGQHLFIGCFKDDSWVEMLD